MKSYLCEACGFFFFASLPNDLSEAEIREATTCPCGHYMDEVEFSQDFIPTFPLEDAP